MHKFTDRLTTIRGIPAYEILGCTKEHKDPFVMYREYMTGYKSCRNIYTSIYNHYEAFGTGKPEWGAEPGKNYFVISWEE